MFHDILAYFTERKIITMKIVILDTGLSKDYISSCVVTGFGVKNQNNTFVIEDAYNDEIGHGTGIVDVLLKYSKNVEITVVKLYESENFTDIEKLSFTLKYIKENIEFDMLQISFGVNIYIYEIHQIIREIAEQNKCVIAAFDNEGGISYPAAFEEVIGIDINYSYKDLIKYDIVEGNVIDVRGGDIYYRLQGIGGKQINKGTSFLVSYFSAMIANMHIKDYSKVNVMRELKKKATRIYLENRNTQVSNDSFERKIKRAVVFPFNKEVHSIAAFEELLKFEVLHYYDIKHKFLIGKKIGDLLGYCNNEKIIENINDIQWDENFDTFICGHIGEINTVTKENYLEKIVEECAKHNKKLFLFDNAKCVRLFGENQKVYYPHIDYSFVPENRFGKLRTPGVPILAVMGTSSKQGKFTVQLNLLREFGKRNIKIDGIGSEPSSCFFGYSQVYPFGYGACNNISNENMIKVLNEMIWNIEKQNVDLILVGSQSGSVPYDLRNESLILIQQYAFLLGTNPDGVILCINNYDEDDYIRRTIHFIESAVYSKVIALVVNTKKNKTENLERAVRQKCIETMKIKFGLPTFDLLNLQTERLVDVIEEYYK